MPRLVVTKAAAVGLSRCRRFLYERNPEASERADLIIEQKLAQLERNPAIGRPVKGRPGLRELVIGFGKSGYLAQYLHEPEIDTVLVLAFRHQREAHY